MQAQLRSHAADARHLPARTQPRQASLQSFAWTEGSAAERIAERNAAGGPLLQGEPMFVFERALFGLFFSRVLYSHDTVRPPARSCHSELFCCCAACGRVRTAAPTAAAQPALCLRAVAAYMWAEHSGSSFGHAMAATE